MKLFVLLTLICLIFTGCSSLSVKQKLESYEPGKRLLFLSILGSDFDAQIIGTTIFNNDWKNFDVSSWELDKAVEEKVLKTSSDSKFSFEFLDHISKEKLGIKENEIKDPSRLISRVKELGPDLLVVFAPTRTQYTHSPQGPTHQIEGLGLAKRSVFGNEQKTFLYSSVKTYIYDLSTQQELGSEYTQGMKFSNDLHFIKFKDLDETHIEKTKDEMTERLILISLNHLRSLGLCNCWEPLSN